MKKKTIALALVLVMAFGVTMGGTFAYLTAQDTVTNTFTVGNVTITLDEADVKTDGTYETNKEARVDANTYHLIPGHTYIKDPTIHVDEKSENCWLFVEVEDGLEDIQDVTTIADQMAAKGWSLVTGETNVYAKEAASKAGDDVVVFDNFKLKGDANVSEYANAQIIVTAYAVQADGFATAQAAWDATFGKPTETPAA